MLCGSCGSDNPDNMRFCGDCGQPLAAAPSAAAPPPAAPPPPAPNPVPEGDTTAERRQVTVLFCDLVGSTQLSDRLDPRDLREIVRAYQAAVSDVVERYEGHIAQYQGDGVLVYFGYPRALEDAARRAVLASREIIAAVAQQSAALERERGLPIAVRLGVHTGEGVTGALGTSRRNEQLLIGSTPTIASKIQSLARPGELVIGHTTKLLVEAHFEVEPIDAPALVTGGVEAYRVNAERTRDGRLAAVRSLGKLIGRAAEVERLATLFEDSRQGQGRAVLVSGEAGLGKSRLLHALEARVPAAFALLAGQCSLYAQNTALFPLVEPFERLFGIESVKAADERRAAVFAHLEALGEGSAEMGALAASLFGLAPPDGFTPAPLTPQKQLEALFEALTRILVRRSEKEPVVLALEDLHWADPTTLKFVDQLIVRVVSARVLVVCTSRPGVEISWPDAPHATRMELRRLPRESVVDIIVDRAGGKALPAAIVDQIVQRADGVPLFAEELTRAVLESGMVVATAAGYELARPLEAPEVPASLRDSLMARLDRFGPAKEVAQIASAIGRFVPWGLLAQVAPFDEGALRAQLARLVEAEIVTRELSADEEMFVFRHALIQDVAHDSMLRARRREVHERVARVLSERFQSVADEQPELLARHFEEAGLAMEATGHLLRGGMRAMGRGAPQEAIAQLSHGVELLIDKPEAPERWGRELQLRAILAGGLMSTRGYAAPETEEMLTRSRELCGFLGDPPEVFMVLYGLWVMHTARGNAMESERYAGEIMKFVTPEAPVQIEIPARFAAATTLLYMARYEEALVEFRRIQAIYTPEVHPVLVQTFGDDHGAFAMSYMMLAELLMGRFDRAREVIVHERKLAEAHGDPLTRANLLGFTVVLQFLQRRPDLLREAAEEGLEISNRYGYRLWRSIAGLGHGWHRAVHAADASAIDELKTELSIWERLNERVPLSLWTGYLVEALYALGRYSEAIDAVDRTLADAAGTLDQMYEPELIRMRGECLLSRDGDMASAAEHFRRAIGRAREQRAGTLELRAALSLAEVSARRGDLGAARGALEEALAKVTGAEELPEYVRGKALLA